MSAPRKLDGSELWELLFSELEGDIPDALNAKVLEAAAVQINDWFGSTAAHDVMAERRRQIHEEGFDAKHDDATNTPQKLALAAACYAVSGGSERDPKGMQYNAESNDRLLAAIQFVWPRSWSWMWWRPKTARRDLVKSAALAIAAIEQIDRQQG